MIRLVQFCMFYHIFCTLVVVAGSYVLGTIEFRYEVVYEYFRFSQSVSFVGITN